MKKSKNEDKMEKGNNKEIYGIRKKKKEEVK